MPSRKEIFNFQLSIINNQLSINYVTGRGFSEYVRGTAYPK